MAEPYPLKYEGWQPDSPSYSDGEIDALNVIPDPDGYRPLPAFASVVTGLDSRAMGAGAVQDTAGNAAVFAGNQAKLWKNSSSTFANVSKAAGYTTADDGRWEFSLYGTNVVATNYDDPVQNYDMASSALFADLITGTYKPKARTLAVVGEFLILGNTVDGTDGAQPSRVWWSSFNNIVNFDPAASTQSDFQTIPTGGWVQKLVGGEYLMVFMDKQIIRAPYVGPQLIFDFSQIVDRQRGTPIPGSVAAQGRLILFISEDGIYAQDGVGSTPVGVGKVNRWFWNLIQTANFSRVSSAIDPLNNLYMVAFPGTGSTGNPNYLLILHWPSGRFAYAQVDTEIVFSSLTLGYTLDALDAISATLEALPYSLDSRAWTGGKSQLGVFDTTHAAGTFSGSNLAASITTREFQMYPGRSCKMRKVRPIVDTSAATVSVGVRRRQADAVTTKTATAMESSGVCGANAKGMYQRVTTAIPAASTWTFAQGVECYGEGGGYRA